MLDAVTTRSVTAFNYLRMPLTSQDPSATLVSPYYQALKATTEVLRATVSQRAGRISADEKKIARGVQAHEQKCL
jgi:hypothetical protein